MIIHRFQFFCIITVMVIGLSATTSLATQPVLRASISSQVAEAYGKGILPAFEKETGISVQLYVGPSDIAVQRLVNGVSDIAATTIGLPHSLKAGGYVEIPFCRDAIAVITNAQCTLTRPCEIDNMSLDQLRDIFSGRITNWKALGGPDQRIITIVPGMETGAYQNFKRQVMRVKEIKYDFITYQSTMAIEGVRSIPGTISILAQGAVPRKDGLVKVIKVNGFSPTEKDYPISQVYSFVTKGTPSHLAQAAINYGLSKKGMQFMKNKDMFPIFK